MKIEAPSPKKITKDFLTKLIEEQINNMLESPDRDAVHKRMMQRLADMDDEFDKQPEPEAPAEKPVSSRGKNPYDQPKPKAKPKGKVTRTTTQATLRNVGIKFRKEGNFIVATATGPEGKKAEGRAKLRGSMMMARQRAAMLARNEYAKRHVAGSTKTTTSDR